MTTAAEQHEMQLVVFDLAAELYGVEISVVREIIRMQALTRVPRTAEYVEGVINLRGKVTPVIDLRKRLDLTIAKQSEDTRIVVVDVNDKDIGVIVDGVAEVLRISSNQVEPTSSVMTTTDSKYLLGIAKLEDRLVILLDLPAALAIVATDAVMGLEEPAPTKKAAPKRQSRSKDTPSEVNTTNLEEGGKLELVESSFKELAPKGEAFVSSFYDRLFQMYPESKAFFENVDMKEQQKKLLASLVLVVNNLRKPDVLGPALKGLGEKHTALGVKQEHYGQVGNALLETFGEYFGAKWNDELKGAWTDAYGAVVAGMTA